MSSNWGSLNWQLGAGMAALCVSRGPRGDSASVCSFVCRGGPNAGAWGPRVPRPLLMGRVSDNGDVRGRVWVWLQAAVHSHWESKIVLSPKSVDTACFRHGCIQVLPRDVVRTQFLSLRFRAPCPLCACCTGGALAAPQCSVPRPSPPRHVNLERASISCNISSQSPSRHSLACP